ncbi:PolC-type DNA polymerase III [Bifidobacterium bombi]|uniref:Exonuclease n=1 Tax=Bifidobacterium bombi DSM 19703 TaxID=1341695 RepID=A0A080N6J7_9BIFI|nr:3'-5' exonuclease [Bifidobacterium bombi]KFF31684.1 exonuclease [Bifidobacterium bombi DSM 19703]
MSTPGLGRIWRGHEDEKDISGTAPCAEPLVPKVRSDNDGLPLDYVVLDTETTGLNSGSDRIIEIGAVKVRGRVVVDRFSVLVNPGRPLSGKIVELTGMTDSMLADQPPIKDVLPKFVRWIGDDVLVGHNLKFDMGFLGEEADRNGIDFPGPACIDTLQMSRAMFPQERHHRLKDLIQRFGIADAEEHRALSDAIQTQQCFEWMRQYVSQLGGTFATRKQDNTYTSRITNTTQADNTRTAGETRHFGGHDQHRARNPQPIGKCIVENDTPWQSAYVSKPAEHQNLFTRFLPNDEIWVSLTHGRIQTGKYKGYPTIDVWIDGEFAGSLTANETAKHYDHVPDEGGISYAHFRIDKKSGNYQLRVSFPYSDHKTDLTKLLERQPTSQPQTPTED